VAIGYDAAYELNYGYDDNLKTTFIDYKKLAQREGETNFAILRKHQESLVYRDPMAQNMDDPTDNSHPLLYQPDNKWADIDVSEPMEPFRGYEMTMFCDIDGYVFKKPRWFPSEPFQISCVPDHLMPCGTFDYRGKLNLSDVTITDTLTKDVDYRGQYVYANSYTLPIKIGNLQESDFVNLEQTIYDFVAGTRDDWKLYADSMILYADSLLLDTTYGYNDYYDYYNWSTIYRGGYIAHPINLSMSDSIAPMSGFMVRSMNGLPTSAERSFRFRYDATYIPDYQPIYTYYYSSSEDGTARPTPDSYPRLSLIANGKSSGDITAIYSVDGTTKGFDNGWDGRKIFGQGTAIYVFDQTDGNNNRFQISSDADLNGTLIGFRSAEGDSICKLRFGMQNIEQRYEALYIEDLVDSTITEITNGLELTFDATATAETEARFRIIAQTATPTDIVDVEADDENSNLSLTLIGDERVLLLNNTGFEGKLSLYDVAGRMVNQYAVTADEMQTFELSLPSGAYVIEATTTDGSRAITKGIVR